jgi:hypothetical protein
MRIQIEIDRPMFRRLMEVAVQERRSVGFQAEVELRKHLGLWPIPADEPPNDAAAERELVVSTTP